MTLRQQRVACSASARALRSATGSSDKQETYKDKTRIAVIGGLASKRQAAARSVLRAGRQRQALLPQDR